MTPMINRPPLSERLTSSKVIAVLRASHASALAPVCDVLVEEGILSLELTLTTPGLFDALPQLVNRYATAADVGVVRLEDQVGAERHVAVFPGGLTPTELAAGWDAGATAVKIFPAETVGAAYLKHLRGPLPDLEAIPSGGVDLDATREWLQAGAVAVSIGGPLLGDALKGGDLSALRERCRAVRALVEETVPS